MKVTSKTVYATLRSALAPLMRQNGFKSIKSGRLGWARPMASGTLVRVWFQCDKWGWDKHWGSQFTVEFMLTPASAGTEVLDGWSGKEQFERLGYVLEGFPALDELRIRNNEVIQRLPGTLIEPVVMTPEDGKAEMEAKTATMSNGALTITRQGDSSETIIRGVRVDPEKMVLGRDIWLRYYSVEDVQAWGVYFEQHLPEFISIFENRIKSEAGRARERFDAMMGRVQKAATVAEKVRILEKFIVNEANDTFRSSARTWLEYVNAKIRFNEMMARMQKVESMEGKARLLEKFIADETDESLKYSAMQELQRLREQK
ncbi:MAG: hypothetical protein LBI48_04010 [Burkholderiaceae bacterium]|jgi:hypothetical protein|nr:hypothetical protein [Burkholderiaceae bacterium]